MARHTEGELGGINGRVGTMVVSKWNGIPVVRRAPRFSPNRKFTDKQTVQQAKFRLAAKFFKRFTELLQYSFEPTTGQSGRSEAFHVLVKQAITGTYPNFSIDYSKVQVAKGKLTPSVSGYVEPEPGAVRFHWQHVVMGGSVIDNDGLHNAILVIYCPEINYLYFDFNGPVRSAETALVNVPYFAGKDVHTWLSFRSPDGLLKADSLYTGTVMVS